MVLITLFFGICVQKLRESSFAGTKAVVRSNLRNPPIHQDYYLINMWQEAHSMSHQDPSLHEQRHH